MHQSLEALYDFLMKRPAIDRWYSESVKKLATCLILLLTMALPLQSVASVSQIFCHTSSVPEDHHDHEHGHEHEATVSGEATNHDGHTVSNHQCSHCAQCCSAPALPAHTSASATHVQIGHVWIATLQQMHSDVEPRFLERPPRAPGI